MLNKVFIDYNPNLVDSATIKKVIDKTGYKSYTIPTQIGEMCYPLYSTAIPMYA